MNNRYYNPEWGRFLNADNYISTDTGPSGYNMYAYCNNNFIKHKDYDGHFIIPRLVITLAALGGALLGYNYYHGKKKAKEISKVQQKKRTKEIFDRTAELNAKCEQSTKKLQETVKGKDPIEALTIFKDNVTDHVKYDLKNTSEWNEELIYNGTVFDPQDTGNFHYGYIGRAIRYLQKFLRWELVKINLTNIKWILLNIVLLLQFVMIQGIHIIFKWEL